MNRHECEDCAHFFDIGSKNVGICEKGGTTIKKTSYVGEAYSCFQEKKHKISDKKMPYCKDCFSFRDIEKDKFFCATYNGVIDKHSVTKCGDYKSVKDAINDIKTMCDKIEKYIKALN